MSSQVLRSIPCEIMPLLSILNDLGKKEKKISFKLIPFQLRLRLNCYSRRKWTRHSCSLHHAIKGELMPRGNIISIGCWLILQHEYRLNIDPVKIISTTHTSKAFWSRSRLSLLPAFCLLQLCLGPRGPCGRRCSSVFWILLARFRWAFIRIWIGRFGYIFWK